MSPLPQETQRALCAKAQRGDTKARDAMIRASMGLVYSIARKLGRPRSDDDLADLVSEGSIGLLTAIQRFDPDRGVAFSTYAHHWIGHHVRVASTNLQGLRRRDMQNLPMKREVDALVEAGASMADAAAAVAEKRGVKKETVLGTYDRLSARTVSLDKPVGDEGSATLGDLLGEDPQVDDQLDRARQLRTIRDRIDRFRRTLSPREAAILDQRILEEEGASKLHELGEEFGISRERVRQIEVIVRKKLTAAVQSLRTDAAAQLRHCVLCGARLRRHNKRDRCRAHGPSITFDIKTGRCLTCGHHVPAPLRSAHLRAHRHGPPKALDRIRRDARERQAELRRERQDAGVCVGCGGQRLPDKTQCADCSGRERARGSRWRRRAGVAARAPKLYEHDGQLRSLAQWSGRTGIPVKTLFQRLCVQRWSIARALTEPVGLRPEKAVCVHGHPRTPDNLYVHPKSGTRHCRACMRQRCADRRRLARTSRPDAQ